MKKIWKQPVSLAPFAPVIDQTIVGHLGIEFTEFGPDYICATLPVDHRTISPWESFTAVRPQCWPKPLAVWPRFGPGLGPLFRGTSDHGQPPQTGA